VKCFNGPTTDDPSRWNKEIYAYFALVERVVFCLNLVTMTVVGFFMIYGLDLPPVSRSHTFKNVFVQ